MQNSSYINIHYKIVVVFYLINGYLFNYLMKREFFKLKCLRVKTHNHP